MKPWQKHRQSEGFVGDIHQKKNVLEGYTTLWWKTALTDGCKRSLMHLSLWILLIMAKIEIFHRQRPPWPSLYLSTGLEDRRSHWHVLMHSFSCQDAQNICDDKMWCWMYTEAGMTLQCPGVGGRGRSPLIWFPTKILDFTVFWWHFLKKRLSKPTNDDPSRLFSLFCSSTATLSTVMLNVWNLQKHTNWIATLLQPQKSGSNCLCKI